MQNLNNNNISDEKYISLLSTFSQFQLHFLHQIEIISTERFNSLISNTNNSAQSSNQSNNNSNNNNSNNNNSNNNNSNNNNLNNNNLNNNNLNNNNSNNSSNPSANGEEQGNNKENSIIERVEKIIAEDKVEELGELINDIGMNSINNITNEFIDVLKMKMPLIHYCILKNAKECFKYLLVNGYDDPNKTMEEQNPCPGNIPFQNKFRYAWDCMALAIFLGKKEIIKILEEKEFEKGKNPNHIEAAILSYRNEIVEEILDDINDQNEGNQINFLKIPLIAASKNSNFKGAELLLSKGASLNISDNDYQKKKLLF